MTVNGTPGGATSAVIVLDLGADAQVHVDTYRGALPVLATGVVEVHIGWQGHRVNAGQLQALVAVVADTFPDGPPVLWLEPCEPRMFGAITATRWRPGTGRTRRTHSGGVPGS